MNMHANSLSNINDIFFLLGQAVNAFKKEDFSALKKNLGLISTIIPLEKEKGRELLRSVDYIKEMFRFYINPIADSETRKLVLQIWVVALEDDVVRGQCGVENMYKCVSELDCVETLARIAVSYVDDRDEECLKLHNRYHYLTSKSTVKRRGTPKKYRKAITEAAVSKLNALVIFPALDTVLSTLRSLHALICTCKEVERAMAKNHLVSIMCKVLARHGSDTGVIALCLKITKTALASIYEIEKAHASFLDDCPFNIHFILHHASQHTECEDVVETTCSLLKNILTRTSNDELKLKIDVKNFVTNAQENYPLNTNIEVDVQQLLFMLAHTGMPEEHSHEDHRGRGERGGQGKTAAASGTQTEDELKKEMRRRSVRERTVPRPRRAHTQVSTKEELERRHTHHARHHCLLKEANRQPDDQ